MTDHWMPGKMADDLRKAHTERLQAAREWAERCESYLDERLVEGDAKFAVPHINRYVDAKVTLALLERGT